ncbi:putative mitochondrial protein [Tanacetum coccineum]
MDSASRLLRDSKTSCRGRHDLFSQCEIVCRGSEIVPIMTKIEFPKFGGDDVRGWLYKCEQFFLVDNVADNLKVQLASLHLFDVASIWNRQYTRPMGENVHWNNYRNAILQRFGNTFDDPVVEIKNVRHVTTIEDYQNAFDKLISRVDLPVDQLISFYNVGLQTDVKLAVRMFRPRTLVEAYC